MAEPRDDAQERTEEATPKRKQEARDKGQIARSRELNTMGVLMAGAGGLIALGPSMGRDLAEIMKTAFTTMPVALESPLAALDVVSGFVGEALGMIAPFLIVTVVAALLSPMLLGGWSFSLSALGFKWDKIDPIKGMGRLFSLRSLMELTKALAKFLLVTTLAVSLLWAFFPEILGLAREPLEAGIGHAAVMVSWIFLGLGASLVLIAIVDVPFQLWDHSRQQKMTRQEVKEEFKETEGKPEVKAKIRQLQRELANRRMMEEVPSADVVITNPTHFAVALRYKPESMSAPVLVAKGADAVAQRIRTIAGDNGVAVFESPALARAVFFHTGLGDEIPHGLYLAVAQVLAYVHMVNAGAPTDTINPEAQVPAEFSVSDDGRVKTRGAG